MKKWKMRNGNEIKISDMKDSHLINSIKMLQRADRTYLLSYEDLIDEANKRNLRIPNEEPDDFADIDYDNGFFYKD